jgi:hypothetical protein
MSKNILMIADGGEHWIGGVYYCKNILYLMTQVKNLEDPIKVYLYVNEKLADVFEEFRHLEKVSVITFEGKVKDLEIVKLCDMYAMDLIYSMYYKPLWVIEDICIYWIPDFQHIYLPHMFSTKEIDSKEKFNKYIAENHTYLVLSSQDAYNTYKELYPQSTSGVYIVPFISYITNEVRALNDKFLSLVKKRYELQEPYIYVANQFWKHKNHITVFKAINELVNNRNYNITLVCTGNTEDYRNKEHYQMLVKYIKDHKLTKNIKLLGMVPRKDQLAIMKEAELIIQPSLFEGWGTVVEDAKVMDKTMLISDIDVHYEQKNDKCIIFKKDDYIELADYIVQHYHNAEKGSMTEGIIEMEAAARRYSQNLLELINDSDKSYKVKNRLKSLFDKQKSILEVIFKDAKGKNIGIYGVGEHTDAILEAYGNLIGEVNFNIFFFDSNSNKWKMPYHNSMIIDPSEIGVLGLDRIIISSYAYQEEIYNSLKRYEERGIHIIKIYSENDKIQFKS